MLWQIPTGLHQEPENQHFRCSHLAYKKHASACQPLSFFSRETQFYFRIILILKQTRDAIKHTEVLDLPCQRVDFEGASAGHVQKQSVATRSPVRQIQRMWYYILSNNLPVVSRRSFCFTWLKVCWQLESPFRKFFQFFTRIPTALSAWMIATTRKRSSVKPDIIWRSVHQKKLSV